MNNQVCSNNYRLVVQTEGKALRNGCPVLVQDAVLFQDLVDKKYYARCVFEGLTESAIKELFVDVILKADGEEIAKVEDFKYELAGYARDAEFGMNVGIPVEAEKDADTIIVSPKKVLLEDETEAIAEGDLLTLPTELSLEDYFCDAELANEYIIEANVAEGTLDAVVPNKIGNYWTCTCGHINSEDEEICHICGNEAAVLFEKLDVEPLRENLEARKAEEARIREEERIRQEEAKARARKRAKIITIICIIVIALAVGGYFFVTKGLPAIRYNSACDALENGEYEKAYTTFVKLGDYEDSSTKCTEAQYQYGLACLESEEYDKAEDIFTEIKDYKDSEDQLKEAKYQNACNLLEAGKYEDAVKSFKALGKYEDSKDKKLEAMYGYVQDNKDSSNETTYKYLKQLKKASYKKSASIFKDLYAWSVKVVINNKESNTKDSKKSISKYDKIYCHVTLKGGEPDAKTKLRYRATYPDGSATTGSWDKKWKRGTDGQCSFWYDIPEYGTTGTFKVYIYDANSGKQLGSGSVQITN